MKTFHRFLLGLLSSFLLTAGFVRAAAQVDPLNHTLNARPTNTATRAAPDSSSLCAIDDSGL